ncbi:MAG: HAD family phosphatase [Actinomycetota bacterium]
MSGDPSLRAVVFDFGGVLITPITRTFSRLADSLGIDGPTMREIFMGPLDRTTDHPWQQAEQGRLAVADIQDRLPPYAAAHGVELAGDEMTRLLGTQHFEVVDEMVDAVRRSRDRGRQTALLTNTFVEFRPTLEQVLDLSLFDVVVESSAIGARKPDVEAYRATMDALDVDRPDEAVFLDDFGPNLDAAAAFGLRTIHVTDPGPAIAELDLLLGEDARP